MDNFNEGFQKMNKNGVPELPFPDGVFTQTETGIDKDQEYGEKVIEDLNNKYPLAQLYVKYGGSGVYHLGMDKIPLTFDQLTEYYISQNKLNEKGPDDYLRGNL